jgi:hypothetical protein
MKFKFWKLFNLATGLNAEVGQLGAGPCDLIGCRSREGSRARSGSLGQPFRLNSARAMPWRPTDTRAAMASPRLLFLWRGDELRPPTDEGKGGDSILEVPGLWFTPEDERRRGCGAWGGQRRCGT